MYLSSLEIDVHHVRGRTWLASPYRVHQRLAMAFPDGEAGRLLFRIESDREAPRILVQSPSPPDWERAFDDHPVLAGRPLSKELTLRFHQGQRLRFLLRANPTKRKPGPPSSGEDSRRESGPRVGLLAENDQRSWLLRKGDGGGFNPLSFEVKRADKVIFPHGSADAAKQTHLRVDFEGHLEVIDPTVFEASLERGIGPAKAFGFGMLSVAPS